MTASFVLAMPQGNPRDSLVGELDGLGVAVDCCEPSDPQSARALADGRDAVVLLPGADPFDGAAVLADGVTGDLAAAASAASARFILCSTVLIYEDGGDVELTAGDPELDPPAALQPFADAELEAFGSGAEVMVLRLGILLDRGLDSTASLVRYARRPSDSGRSVHLPLLDLATLAATLAACAGSSLHGGWDVVSACPGSGELFGFVNEGQGGAVAPEGPESRAADWAESVWPVSRLVTGDALREAGVPAARPWREFVAEALA